MKPDVRGYIRGVRDAFGEEEATEFSGPGVYRFMGETHVIHYEANGEKVLFKIRPGYYEQTKKVNGVTQKFVFEEGRHYETDYITPVGKMRVAFDTEKVQILEMPGEIDVRLVYQLFLDGALISRCEVITSITALGDA